MTYSITVTADEIEQARDLSIKLGLPPPSREVMARMIAKDRISIQLNMERKARDNRELADAIIDRMIERGVAVVKP